MTSSASPHVSEESLAGVALGDTLPPDQQRHLDVCPNCRLAVSEMLEVITVAYDTSPELAEVEDPPEHVWATVAASASDPNVFPLTSGPKAGRSKGTAQRSRVRGPMMLAAAVVAGVVAGGGLVVAADAWRSTPTVVAAAALEPVPGGPASGQSGVAQVQQAANGEVLTISTADLSAPTGYYEVWLLDPSSGGMIAMGVVPGDTGTATLPVPPGVDLTQYAAVDISDEPMDGNPGHSAVSVLRGHLSV